MPNVRRLKMLGWLIAFIIIGGVLIVPPFLVSDKGKQKEETSPLPTQIDVASVPEMSEILSVDQKTRLDATRRLAERVGVEQALEILEHSSLPHTGEGHLAVHQVGFHAYKIYGTEAILYCKDYFLYACYHGAIIEAASDQGLTSVAQMADTCKGSITRHFQCAHAVGHALLAMWNYDLRQALADCDKVFAKQTDFPQSFTSCHNGAFMENIFGVHNGGTTTESQRNWLKDDDPYFPCNAFGEPYQQGCWLNQAARIYALEKGSISQTSQKCQAIGNRQYTEWCMDALARQIHPLTAGHVNMVYQLCQQVGPQWYEHCVAVNAGAYYSVGDGDTAIQVCHTNLSSAAKADCYQRVMAQLVPDINRSQEQKQALCQGMEESFNKNCLDQVEGIK